MRRPVNLLNGIDLVTLRLLLAAKEEGNFVRVAERENIALSAVSRRVTEFEQRFGFSMFDRHDRGVTPTPDGAIMLERITAAVGELEQVASALFDRRDGVAGIVRVQSHISAVIAGLPERLARFMDAHPDVEVQLEECTSQSIIHAVQAGQCDIGLVSGTVDTRSLQAITLTGDDLVAILPPNSELAARQTLSLDALLDEPFIGMHRDSALLELFRTQAQAKNRHLNVRVHATSFESVRACVAAGLGVAIVPAIAVAPFAIQQGFHMRPLSDGWARRTLDLCYRSKGQVSAAARLLITFLTVCNEDENVFRGATREGVKRQSSMAMPNALV